MSGTIEDSWTGTLTEVRAELEKQLRKWGEQQHADGTGPNVTVLRGIGDRAIGRNMQWITGLQLSAAAREACQANGSEDSPDTWAAILLEEVFEALAEEPESFKLFDELIQVAAVAVQWASLLERKSWGQIL